MQNEPENDPVDEESANATEQSATETESEPDEPIASDNSEDETEDRTTIGDLLPSDAPWGITQEEFLKENPTGFTKCEIGNKPGLLTAGIKVGTFTMDRYYVFGNKTNGSQDNSNQGLSKITYVLSYNDPSIKDLKGSRETLVAAMKNEVGEPDSESKSVTTWIEEEFQIEIGRAKVSKYTGSDEPTIIIIFSEPEPSPDTSAVPVKPSVSDSSFEKIDYNGVSRYPEQYKGKYVMFTGIIVQVMEGDSTVVLRVSTRFKLYYYMGGYETEDIVYVEIE